jgi:hypothetical protein
MVTLGTDLAWIPDPATNNPSDPEDYWNEDAPRIVILTPGTELMVFRRNGPANSVADAEDLKQPVHYWLAVTRDGLWGIIKVVTGKGSDSNTLIGEAGLKAIAKDEDSANDSLYPYIGMVNPASYAAPSVSGPANDIAWLQYGQLVRVLADDGDNSTIDFGGVVASVFNKYSAIPPNEQSGKFLVSDNANVIHALEIDGDIIPRDDEPSWMQGQDVYRDIFEEKFGSIQIPGIQYVDMPCGMEITVSTEQSAGADASISVNIDPSGRWLDAVLGKLDISGGARTSVATSLKTASKTSLLVSEHVYPVIYNGGNGSDTFLAGTAATCTLRSPTGNIRSIVVADPDPAFLYTELYKVILNNGTLVTPSSDDTTSELSSIIGGNPFNQDNGYLNFLCVQQMTDFFNVARKNIGGGRPYRIETAIALASDRSNVPTNLRHFFNNDGCQTKIASSEK